MYYDEEHSKLFTAFNQQVNKINCIFKYLETIYQSFVYINTVLLGCPLLQEVRWLILSIKLPSKATLFSSCFPKAYSLADESTIFKKLF